ncbi:MAG TPA: branched-chain amino acid ABC transporter substrate-binding protein [Myxococcales bacterium]
MDVILFCRMRPLALAAVVMTAVVVAACSSASPVPAAKVLQLGVDLPLTGPEAAAAMPAMNGIRFFVRTHPFLDGFQVVLAARDDAAGGPADPERGVSNVDAFISDSTVVAMLGPFDGAVARKEIPVANAAGLAMVTPATSNPCLTRDIYLPALLNPGRIAVTCKAAGLPAASDLRPSKVNNFFRLAATDELQGAAAADFAVGMLHVVRAAVISDHEAYGQGLAAAFSARFARAGGSVVGRLDVDPAGTTDVAGFLGRAKADGAQAVYWGGASAPGCAIRAQMAAVFPTGEATPFLGGDGIAQDPACVEAAASNAGGVYATLPIADASSQAAAESTLKAFRAAFGTSSAFGAYTLVAYDAAAILYAAIERAATAGDGSAPTRAAVIAALAGTSGMAGVTGELGFDASGDTTNRLVTVFEAPAPGASGGGAWKQVGAVDYSARLPY